MLTIKKVPATIAAIILASVTVGIWIERETVFDGLRVQPVVIPDNAGVVISLDDVTKPTSVVPADAAITTTPETESLSSSSTRIESTSRETTSTHSSTVAATAVAASNGQIKDRVAAITDTQYTANLIPLLLHYNSVLGPEWPIVFFTTQSLIDEHLIPKKPDQKISAAWKKALSEKRIEVRVLPDRFKLGEREGVNHYLADKWMWEQLAPATHVLVFQTDAILCANSPFSIDDYMQYDFVGAYIAPVTSMLYNGGLSLRNRSMIMDILNEGNVWKPHIEGEDVWFSKHMGRRKANLPVEDIARNFALQYSWNFNDKGRPFGYHKIRKNVPDKIEGIAKWCPEIALTQMGTLEH